MENRERKRAPFLLWTGVAAGVSLLLSLPAFDTGLSYHLRELLTDGDYQRLAAGIAVVFLGLELLFLRARKWTVLKWLPVVFPVICLVPGELFWLTGGWDRIAGSILWWFGFPMLMGAGLAVLLTHLPENGKMRTGLAILLVGFVLFCAVFWPRTLGEKLTLDIQGPMLLVDADGATEWRNIDSTDEVERMLHDSELVPAFSPPDWHDGRRVLLRLNGEYIVVAAYGADPCICFYSGPLEEFDGSGVKWRFFHFPALYTELVTSGSAMAE